MRRGELDAKKMRALKFNSTAVAHDAMSNVDAHAIELPMLTDLIMCLDIVDKEFILRNMGANDYNFETVRGIVIIAPLLRNLKLEGSPDQGTIYQITKYTQLETLDLSNTHFCDAESMEIFRCLEDMHNLKILMLPALWPAAMMGTLGGFIKPRVLQSLTVPAGNWEVVHALEAFVNPTVRDLKITSCRLTDNILHELPLAVMSYQGLHSLHIDLRRWTTTVTISALLRGLGGIPTLTSVELFCQQHWFRMDQDILTQEDARYIRHIWPGLRVLGVSMVNLDFFLEILNLPQLAELEVNAGFWDAQCWEGVSNEKHPAISSLHLSGSPCFWNEAGAFKEIYARYPRLKSLVIVKCRSAGVCDCAVYEDSSAEGSEDTCEDDEDVDSYGMDPVSNTWYSLS